MRLPRRDNCTPLRPRRTAEEYGRAVALHTSSSASSRQHLPLPALALLLAAMLAVAQVAVAVLMLMLMLMLVALAAAVVTAAVVVTAAAAAVVVVVVVVLPSPIACTRSSAPSSAPSASTLRATEAVLAQDDAALRSCHTRRTTSAVGCAAHRAVRCALVLLVLASHAHCVSPRRAERTVRCPVCALPCVRPAPGEPCKAWARHLPQDHTAPACRSSSSTESAAAPPHHAAARVHGGAQQRAGGTGVRATNLGTARLPPAGQHVVSLIYSALSSGGPQ